MTTKPKRLRRYFLPLILILILIFDILFEKSNIEYKSYTIEHHNIPNAFDGFKIIQLTDIHYKAASNTDNLEQMVQDINEQNPDIIILTGDYIDFGEQYIEPCTELFSKLRATYGIYGVLGNHDGRGYHNLIVTAFTEIGIQIIEEDYTRINIENQTIYLCGVSDLGSNNPDLDKALVGAKKEDYVILLSHNPNFIKQVDSRHVDLMFSGHNHGGQITLFGLYAPYLPDSDTDQSLVTGQSIVDDTTIIVSNGIGTTVLNLRFFARPQVVITTLWAD
jgi:predicted MPP superfamily phosphohydrolase